MACHHSTPNVCDSMDDLVRYDRIVTPNKHILTDPGRKQFFQRLDDNGRYARTEIEERWSEEYEFLLSHGYQLRPRFRPGWTPSWRGTDLPPVACEDSVEHFSASVIDAKRLEDGRIVAIKRIPPLTFEAEIARKLSTLERLQDPTNHCVPVYDFFSDYRKPLGESFIVMPLLRDFNDPPFKYVDEVVDFVRQTLEGLVYIHSLNVAHRDLSDGNIMMDGRPLYGREGFHPSDQNVSARDIMVYAQPRTRKDTGSVKYYFTDFGLSMDLSNPELPRLITGNKAQDHDIPELSAIIPYDPFPVDVFTLGNVYKRNFLNKYSNLGFLLPLCSSMTARIPRNRPSAADALAAFQQSLSDLSEVVLRWRLREIGETRMQTFLKDCRSAFGELVCAMKLSISFLLSAIRMVTLFPLKVISLLIYYGPRSLVESLQRRLRKPENQPLLG